jgi:copper transport protein
MAMRRARRAIAAILLAGAWLLAGGDAAGAHALLGASDPASGASLDRAPRAVLITFTERPDPGLSSVRVLDQSGGEVTTGKAALVPGRPRQLRTPLRDGLPNGVYSVVWRVLSRDDGHLTTGSFSFGVGVDPGLVPAPQAGPATSSPPPSPLGVAGRWLLYWGLALLVGGAATGLAVFGGSLPTVPGWRGRGGGPGLVLLAAFGLGVVGMVGIALGEWTSAGASLRGLAGSSVGQSLLRQGAALAVAGLAVAAFVARPRARWTLPLVGLAAVAAMLVHAASGHAVRESSLRWLNLLAQWLHLVAVGVWVGGLAWLLLGILPAAPAAQPGGGPPDRTPGPGRVEAVKRFSRLAGWTVLVIAVTGAARALDEVGGWRRLLDTGFGRVVDLKVLLFAALLALGALNRQRLVPALVAGGGSGGLKSEAPAQAVGNQLEPSGSPPVNQGSGGLKSEAPTPAAGGRLEPSGSPPVNQGSGGLKSEAATPAAGDRLEPSGSPPDKGPLGTLRRSVRAELGLAAVVLLAAGLLTELPPGGTGRAARPAAPPSVETSGNDYATSVRVRLVATPGTAGPNGFRATVVDYDSGKPFPAQRVQLRFSLPSRPDLGESTLDLRRGGDGSWSGRGGPLAAQGRWEVSAVVEAPGSAVTVPMQLQTRTVPQRVQVSQVPGQPTVYTVTLAAGGTLQSYADPGFAGRNQVHFTFFGSDGNEQPVGTATATARPPSGGQVRLRLLRLGAGHFAANVDLTQGRWSFAIATGRPAANASFEQVIPK